MRDPSGPPRPEWQRLALMPIWIIGGILGVITIPLIVLVLFGVVSLGTGNDGGCDSEFAADQGQCARP